MRFQSISPEIAGDMLFFVAFLIRWLFLSGKIQKSTYCRMERLKMQTEMQQKNVSQEGLQMFLPVPVKILHPEYRTA